MTPEDKIKIAYLYVHRGMDVTDIALALDTNIYQVSRAVTAVKEAVGMPVSSRERS